MMKESLSKNDPRFEFVEDASRTVCIRGTHKNSCLNDANTWPPRSCETCSEKDVWLRKGEGISQPGHLNFFLVAHQGLFGTSIPCHYHVLHLDQRLVQKGIGADDLERITYDLCSSSAHGKKITTPRNVPRQRLHLRAYAMLI